MHKTVTLRLDDETHTVFQRAARAQRRSLANLIETAALAQLHEEQFADESEMAETWSDPRLLARIEQGSKDAQARRGRYVD